MIIAFFDIKNIDQVYELRFGKSEYILNPIDEIEYSITNQETLTEQKLSSREFDRNKLAVIVLGMAMDRYGYDEKNHKNTCSNIFKIMQSRGISVSIEDIGCCLFDGANVYKDGGGNRTIKEIKTGVEQNTFLKLIIGMAIDAYGYDPQRNRNDASGNNKYSIVGKLKDNHGIDINKGSIQRYLAAAKNLLPTQSQ